MKTNIDTYITSSFMLHYNVERENLTLDNSIAK